MSLILYAQSVIGILFVIRTLQLFREKALLTISNATKFGTIFVCITLWISFFCMNAPILCAALNLLWVFVITETLFLVERQQIDTLKCELPFFLDRWILNSRLGYANSAAREMALRDQSEGFYALMRPLFASQTSSSDHRRHQLLDSTILREFQSIQAEPHTALERMENLREHWRKVSDFRRKSGQALRQTTIQMGVMVILHIALIIITMKRYGLTQALDFILASTLLSALGAGCMYFLARKTKWKI